MESKHNDSLIAGTRLLPARMEPFVKVETEKKVILFSTPGTGLSSIEDHLFQPEKKIRFFWWKDKENAAGKLRPLGKVGLAQQQALLTTDYYRIACLKNPFSRILSVYLAEVSANSKKDWSVLKALGFHDDARPTFNAFLASIDALPDEQRPLEVQSQFYLLGDGLLSFDFLIRFESWEADCQFLRTTMTGMDYETPFREQPTKLPTGTILKYMLPEEQKAVVSIYKHDFRLGNYPTIPAFAHVIGRRDRVACLSDGKLAFKSASLSEHGLQDETVLEGGWEVYNKKEFMKAHERFLAIAGKFPNTSIGNKAMDAAAFSKMKGVPEKNFDEKDFSSENVRSFENIVAPIYEASAAILNKDAEAFWQIATGLPVYDPNFFGPWNRGLSTRPERETSVEIQRLVDEKLEGHNFQHQSEGAAPIILMAADSVYTVRHARLAVQSYRDTGGTERIVIYVINPTSEAEEMAAELMADFNDVEVRFESGHPEIRAYFASFRYLKAAELLIGEACPVFVFDIDVGFRESISEFFVRTEFDRDFLGLRVSPLYCLPWQKITVNSVYFPYNVVGLSFALHMKLFLEMHFSIEENSDLWWIDQNAALSAYLTNDVDNLLILKIKGFLSLPFLFEERVESIKKNLTD